MQSSTRGDVSATFGRDQRIRKRSEFLRIQSTGRRVSSRHFIFLVNRRPELSDEGTPAFAPRVGFVVTRKVGNAVHRNLIKRRCRECYRAWHPPMLPAGVDLVVIARAGADALPLTQIRAEWQSVHSLLRRRSQEVLAQLSV